MFHPQLLDWDWEVVESLAVSPVQVLFKDDGVKIHQIAPTAISGSYTFDMHRPYRTSPPVSPHPKMEAGRPRPVSDPSTSTTESAGNTSYSTEKQHRKTRSAGASATAALNPFTFGIRRRTTLPATTPFKGEPAAANVPGPRPELRHSLGAVLSFLQPRHGRDRLRSRSSISGTKSGASRSGSEDGEVMEPESGSSSAPAVRKEIPTHHNSELYSPIERPKLTSEVSNNNLTTPAAAVAPYPPSLAQPSYDKTQTKKVLKHARAELMKEVRKAGYNVLVVEGWELTVFRQGERYRIEVVYRARPAIAQSDSVEGEDMQIPRNPPYLSVLDD